jgi:hypothetical protein
LTRFSRDSVTAGSACDLVKPLDEVRQQNGVRRLDAISRDSVTTTSA